MSFNSEVKGKIIKENKISKSRLWVISELYYPEETSTGYYLTKIAEGLVNDFEVKVICGQPNYSARDITAPKFERHKEVDIYRAFGTRLNKNVIPYRILNMLTLSISIFILSIFKFRKGDKILVVTTPPLLPFITGISSKIRKAKHILLIHDNYPEILLAVDKVKPDSVFTKILNKFNSWLYNNAHKIIVVGRDMQKLVLGKFDSIKSKKVFVIPNWGEVEELSPENKIENELIEELNIKNKLVFLYAGNMGYPNDIETFLDVALNLNEDKRFHFIFLGEGVKKPLLINTIKLKQIKNITVLDSKPRSMQQTFLNACDVAIVSLIDQMWGVSMPSRTYNILAVGKPILALCENGSEIDLVVKDDSIGWSIKPFDPETLLETIYNIYDLKADLSEMGNRAREVALNKYTLNKALNSYKKVLNQVASDNEDFS